VHASIPSSRGAARGEFWDLSDRFDVSKYHYVVVQAGIVECDRGHDDERLSQVSLLRFLERTVERLGDRCPTFLIVPTIPYFDCHKSTPGYGRWLHKKLQDCGSKVRVLDWDSISSPFFPNQTRNKALFDDKTHLNRDGVQRLWRACHTGIPELALIPCEFYGSLQENPAYKEPTTTKRPVPTPLFSMDCTPAKMARMDHPGTLTVVPRSVF